MKVRIAITGTTPLMMHNARLASPMNAYTKRLKVLMSKPGKDRTDEDRIEAARVEWEGGMYYDLTIGPYLPAQNVWQTIREGARQTRNGPKIEKGLVMTEMTLPLLYKGPRDLNTLWGDDGDSPYVDLRSVGVNGKSRVDRCRPIFAEWAVEAEAIIDTTQFEVVDLQRFVDAAGRLLGLGDHRKAGGYGRFESVISEL